MYFGHPGVLKSTTQAAAMAPTDPMAPTAPVLLHVRVPDGGVPGLPADVRRDLRGPHLPPAVRRGPSHKSAKGFKTSTEK